MVLYKRINEIGLDEASVKLFKLLLIFHDLNLKITSFICDLMKAYSEIIKALNIMNHSRKKVNLDFSPLYNSINEIYRQYDSVHSKSISLVRDLYENE